MHFNEKKLLNCLIACGAFLNTRHNCKKTKNKKNKKQTKHEVFVKHTMDVYDCQDWPLFC